MARRKRSTKAEFVKVMVALRSGTYVYLEELAVLTGKGEGWIIGQVLEAGLAAMNGKPEAALAIQKEFDALREVEAVTARAKDDIAAARKKLAALRPKIRKPDVVHQF